MSIYMGPEARCYHCGALSSTPHDQGCAVNKGIQPLRTSSEDSTTTDPQAQKQLHEVADRFIAYEKNQLELANLCGMQLSAFWPIAQTALLQLIHGLLQSGMQPSTTSSNDSLASGPPPAPSSQASTQPVASDVRTQDESHLQSSLEETDAEKAFNLLLTRIQELQDQINIVQEQFYLLETSTDRRLTMLEIGYQRLQQTSATTRKASSTTSPKAKTARSPTTPSASTRSTSKRSRRPKRTTAGSVSSSAKRNRVKTGAISSLPRAKRLVATRLRNSLKGA
jgi:hypothetical protein